jgi:hypothetical protein
MHGLGSMTFGHVLQKVVEYWTIASLEVKLKL